MLLHLLVKNDYQIYSELMELNQFEIVHTKNRQSFFTLLHKSKNLTSKKNTTNYVYESVYFVSDMRTIRERER